MSMLDAVYFDTRMSKSIVAARPKPPFKPIFQVAASREGSGIRIVNEPYLGSSVFLVEAGERRAPPETRMTAATDTTKNGNHRTDRFSEETTLSWLGIEIMFSTIPLAITC